MSIFLNAARSWIYERDPIAGMKFTKPFAEIQAALAKDGQKYLEALIEKHLIKNPHRLSLEGVPDTTMVAAEEAAELIAEQKSVDTKEDLATMPTLKLADLTMKE